MSDQSPPPPPPAPEPHGTSFGDPGATHPYADSPGARASARPWKIATAIVALLAVAGIVTTYLVMDARLSDTRAELADTQRQLEEAESSGGLEDLLGDLLGGEGAEGLEDLLGEGGLDELLGEGGLDDLLGGGSSDLGSLDPALFQCLSGGGLGDGLPDGDIEEQVATIQQLIADDRGFDAVDDVDIEFVSRDEVQRRAVDISEDEIDRDAAAADAVILGALGAIEPGADLVDLQLQALEGGVGGFYDPDTGQLVIGSEELDGMGTYVTAHEMVHALADAQFDLPDTVSIADDRGADAAYAALNAIEGDASLYGQAFAAEHLSMADLLGMQTESDATTEELADLPHFVNRNLTFPYVEGMTFSCHVYLDGGWEAVDATYTDVPTTTAQILFPERYTEHEDAVEVRDVTGPDGWERVDHDTFGAADLLFLLEAPGDDPDAALSDPVDRVRAWAGGEVNAWSDGDQTAVSLILADHGDADYPLCQTIDEFYGAAFPAAERSGEGGEVAYRDAGQAAIVRCRDAEVALGIGPDLDTAAAAIG